MNLAITPDAVVHAQVLVWVARDQDSRSTARRDVVASALTQAGGPTVHWCKDLDDLLAHVHRQVRVIVIDTQGVDPYVMARCRQALHGYQTDWSLPVVLLKEDDDAPWPETASLDEVATAIKLRLSAVGDVLPGVVRLSLRQATQADAVRSVLHTHLFESLLELLPVGIMIAHDPQCEQVTLNQSACQLLGLSPAMDQAAQIFGDAPTDLVFYDAGRRVAQENLPLCHAARTGQAVRGKAYQIVRRDGTRLEVVAYAVPLFNAQRQAYGSLAVMVDITRQKQVEVALVESESRLMLAQECAWAGSWEWNLTTGELIWSDAQCALHGLPSTRLIPFERWMSLIDSRDEPAVRRALVSYQAFQLEYRLAHPRQDVQWVLASGQIRHDEQGRPHRVLGICMDITGHKLVEQASRANAVRFRTMVDASPLGVFITGPDGHYQYTNAQLQQMAGVEQETLRQQGLLHLAHPADRAQAQLAWKQAMTQRQSYDYICRLMPPNRPVIWVHLRASPVIDEGQLIGYIGKAEDITRRRAAEAQFRLSQSRLRIANTTLAQRHEDMEELLSITAHDLKHPVVGIQGLLSLLRADSYHLLSEDDRVNLDMALGECDRMKEMLTRLSELGRIEQTQPRLAKVSLGDVVDTCLHRHQADYIAKGIVMQVVSSRTALVMPRAIIEEALSNLIDNAIKYGCPSPEHNIVRIEANHDEQWCSLKVTDHGPGIASQHHERVFRPFQRLGGPTRPAGSGIGLTAVKRLIQRIGGQIELVSSPGQGASFLLRFPHGSPTNLSDEPAADEVACPVV